MFLSKDAKKTIPKERQDVFNWNGWGYKDSKFCISKDEFFFSGDRYPIGGGVALTKLKKYISDKFELNNKSFRDSANLPSHFPQPFVIEKFVSDIKAFKIEFSIDGIDRFIRCHGQSLADIYRVRKNQLKRIPDIVLWPKCHEEVSKIVQLAFDQEIVLIPFGGGTSVSGAVSCPQTETRSIAVVDTTQMNKLLWLDKENLTACFESGIVGQDLERILQAEGLTMGHEPDSIEFSTLGGWIATRASGMKRNVYGNIEDLVVRVKMMTCKGVFEKKFLAPRVSCGPDFDHLILGSEGMFGIVTEVVVKVRPLPKVKRYGSLVFPNFDIGVKFLHEIAIKKLQPASIRLIDNEQFQFSHALNVDTGIVANLKDKLKKFALTKIKGFDVDKIAVVTLLFEGDENDVQRQENLIYEVVKKHHGFNAGAKNGQKGYVLTFVIAYMRDFALGFGIFAESFETSVCWNKCETLCNNVKSGIHVECKKFGIKNYLVSCRVTQIYDVGACVYFYFGYRWNFDRNDDPIEIYKNIENKAREIILISGGSISHHHGVGKIRSMWYRQSVSEVGINVYKSLKMELDPKHIFALNNFLQNEEMENYYISKL